MNNKRRAVPGIRPYDGPAGGWGALKATAIAVRTQMDARMLPPRCCAPTSLTASTARAARGQTKSINPHFSSARTGQKRSREATSKRVTPEFLAHNTVTSLLAKSDFELEGYGRLTHPLRYDRASDTFRPVEWEDAFERIGEVLRGLEPDRWSFIPPAAPPTKRPAVPAFAREYGTNNFPDCSNMCHEATSVGLPRSIGIGKGTVSLDDFDKTELVISIGHNPGTNHPRMMGTLHELARRGVPILVLNPLRERAGTVCRSAERD